MAAWGWFCVALLATWMGTALARRYALRRQLMDLPGERRNHAVATPRGGGVAMVLVLVVALLALSALEPRQARALLPAALSVVLVGAVGWWDDHRPLPVSLRLLVHLAAAACIGVAGWLSGWPLWITWVGAGLALVLVNFWNFMDGIDGIAASQALLVAVSAACLSTGAWQLASISLAGAALGFMAWNFPKARIFMGDAGSGVLGLAVAWLWIATGAMRPSNAALLLFPMGPFLMDAGATLAMRMLRRERWWEGHSSHTYQLLARRLGSHVPVTVAYALVTFAGMAAIPMLVAMKFSFILAALAAWYTALGILWGLSRMIAMDRVRPAGSRE